MAKLAFLGTGLIGGAIPHDDRIASFRRGLRESAEAVGSAERRHLAFPNDEVVSDVPADVGVLSLESVPQRT